HLSETVEQLRNQQLKLPDIAVIEAADTVQASLMIFALILTPIIVLISTGGVDTTFLAIEAQNPANFDMLKGATFVGIISLM
ncbi:hypothetical protein SB861_66940, partial [Paraburkholderia sp. SIMBA_049]